jgi:hypothetical protein
MPNQGTSVHQVGVGTTSALHLTIIPAGLPDRWQDSRVIQHTPSLPVTVSRWVANRENGAQTYVIPPYNSHTFSGFYQEDNWPESVTMHIRTPSNNVSAGYQVVGDCWYIP